MAFMDKDEAKYLLAAAVGMAALGLVKGLTPAFAGLGRPLAKATIKGGLLVYQKGRLMAAEMGEVVEDLFAEARAELEGQAEVRQEEVSANGGKVQ
ncbi:MAG TPA: DUF5132 domain-containing protein [Bryobacteraceae bacterium]|nr:DUF5132 domain-containing protein [Bryobacteraceae bacterium]